MLDRVLVGVSLHGERAGMVIGGGLEGVVDGGCEVDL